MSTSQLFQFAMDEDDVNVLHSSTMGQPSNVDINVLSQKHDKVVKSNATTPRMSPYVDDYNFDEAVIEDAPNNGIIPFGNNAVKDSAKNDDCTHSRNLSNDAVISTVATSPVVNDGLNENEIGAFPFGNDNNGPPAPKAVNKQTTDNDDDDDAAVALFLNASITSPDGTTMETVQLGTGGVQEVLKENGYDLAAMPNKITIQRHEQMRIKPVRNYSAFLAQNTAIAQNTASTKLKNAVHRAQSGRYNKRQKVTASNEQPPPKVNNSFEKKRENDRRSLYANLRRYRKVTGRYSLGVKPHNLLIDAYTTAHAVTDDIFHRIIAKMTSYPTVIKRGDYRPVVVPSPVEFSGPGITAMGVLRSQTWQKMRSIDTDERHILSFVTPESGDVKGGNESIIFNPFTANGGIVALLHGYELKVNEALHGVMAYQNMPISIKLKAPSYKWMDVDIQLQSRPGGRVPLRDVHDDVLRRQIVNGYNRKVMNTFYGAASYVREFHNDFYTDIDLNGLFALFCIPPLTEDAFILRMNNSVISDKLIRDTSVWSFSLDNQVRDNHFSHPVNAFPFDFENKIEKICQSLFINMDSVVLDRYMDSNKGDCDKHVRRATVKDANKLFLTGIDPIETHGFLHEIRVMVHSNKINTSAGLVNIVEASPSNINFVCKSTIGYCANHRTLGKECGGIKCADFAEKKAIHDRVIKATYKNKSIDQKALLCAAHSLKLCSRCGGKYTTKHDVCPLWRDRIRDDRDGSQALLFTSGSPAHTAKITFIQNIVIQRMLGLHPHRLSDVELMDWRSQESTKQKIGNLTLDDLFFHDLVESKEEKSEALDSTNQFAVTVCMDKVDAMLALKYSFRSKPLQTKEIRYTITATVPNMANDNSRNNNSGFSRITADF